MTPENDDQRTGVDIVRKALSSPARQIVINAGEDGSVVVGKIIENDSYAYGYDAQQGKYGDLISKGIMDPTRVVRTALQDAASIAGLLITTEAMVAEKPKKERRCRPYHPEAEWTTNLRYQARSEPTFGPWRLYVAAALQVSRARTCREQDGTAY